VSERTVMLLCASFFLLVRCVWWRHRDAFFSLSMADGMAFLLVLLFENCGGAVAST
jgi:hypothetical protein